MLLLLFFFVSRVLAPYGDINTLRRLTATMSASTRLRPASYTLLSTERGCRSYPFPSLYFSFFFFRQGRHYARGSDRHSLPREKCRIRRTNQIPDQTVTSPINATVSLYGTYFPVSVENQEGPAVDQVGPYNIAVLATLATLPGL